MNETTHSLAVKKVAIAGCGTGAMATAIQLALAGVEVDIFEQTPELSALGSGVTLMGNSLRAFDTLGVWDRIKQEGYPFEGLAIRAAGPGAEIVMELPNVKCGGPDYPAAMGIYRPVLARVLADRATEVGAKLHFGSKITGFEQDDSSVEVFVNGESAGRYDLLVGADGLHSTVRDLLGIETKPEPTGMGIFRAFVKRPAEVERNELYYGGPALIAGYTPTGKDSMYTILVERANEDHFHASDEEAIAAMIELSKAYAGPWDSIRESLSTGKAQWNYTFFTSHLVEEPWHRGRVVIIGDAAHSCPPTIAQGAAMALEDALVLTELLTSRDQVDESLWEAFYARRIERARIVVENSVQIGKWQLEGNKDENPGELIYKTSLIVAEPA